MALRGSDENSPTGLDPAGKGEAEGGVGGQTQERRAQNAEWRTPLWLTAYELGKRTCAPTWKCGNE